MSGNVTVEYLIDVGYGVRFRVGVQDFDIGPQDFETRAEAEWFADQFRHALNAMIEEERKQ